MARSGADAPAENRPETEGLMFPGSEDPAYTPRPTVLNGIAGWRSLTHHWHMTDRDDAAPPAFIQVLCIGRAATSELIAALRRDGVAAIVAFDSGRGEQLLNYVRPDAILCAAADAKAVRAYAGSAVRVIVLGHEQWAGVDPAATVISSTLDVADVAHRLHEDIAAHRSAATHFPTDDRMWTSPDHPLLASERQPAL